MSGFIDNVHITLFQGFNVHPNPHCPATRYFKSAYTALRVMYYSTPCKPYLTYETFKTFITTSLLLCQIFGQVNFCRSTSSDLHNSNLPCHVHGGKPSPIPLVLLWQKARSTQVACGAHQEWETISLENAFLKTTILVFLNSGLTDIFPPTTHNTFLLLLSYNNHTQ